MDMPLLACCIILRSSLEVCGRRDFETQMSFAFALRVDILEVILEESFI